MKKVWMIAAMAVLLFTLVYQGSMAFFHAEKNMETRISAGTLGIELVDFSNDKNAIWTDKGYQFNAVMPGATLARELHVENVKQKTLYLRVTATKYWVDKNNKKLTAKDASFISLVTKDKEDWIIQDDAANSNSEIVYFYYKYPLKSGEHSPNIMDAIQISDKIENQEYADYHANVLVEADAVQDLGATEAMLSEWGMNVTIDQNGTIVSVEE